jgi:hypothetical protein
MVLGYVSVVVVNRRSTAALVEQTRLTLKSGAT